MHLKSFSLTRYFQMYCLDLSSSFRENFGFLVSRRIHNAGIVIPILTKINIVCLRQPIQFDENVDV